MSKSNRQNSNRNIRLIVAAIILLALSAAALIVIDLLSRDIDTAEAYGYNIIYSDDPAEAARTNIMKSQEDTKKLSKMLSGRYRFVKRTLSLRSESKDEVLAVVPMYLDSLGNTDDALYQKTSGMYSDADGLFSKTGIYILTDTTIAVWDVRENRFWIGEKIGKSFDREYIKSLLTKETPEEDIISLEGEPAY